MKRRGFASWLGVALALAPPVGAPLAEDGEDASRRLKSVERELREAQKRQSDLARRAEDAAAEVNALKRRMVRVAREAQRHEAELSRIEGRTKDLSARMAAADARWRKKRAQMIALLAALERVAQHPPVALVALPGDPADTLRTAILIRSTVPALEQRSRALRRQVQEMAGLRAELDRQHTRLETAEKELGAKRRELTGLIDTKSRLERRAREESAAVRTRALALAVEAKDLKELLARLEAAREQRRIEDERLARQRELQARARAAPAAPPPAPVAGAPSNGKKAVSVSVAALAARPGAGLPARGRLVRRFGERTGVGGGAKGLSIRTRTAAQVVAPRSGEVVFAGPFRGYGQLLIVRHDDGYYVLLSGMARIDAAVGDRVLAGEPVGVMPSESNTQPTLYVELRRNGQPINPMPWLSASRSKVNG